MLESAGGTTLNDPDGTVALGVLVPPLKPLPLEELELPNPVPLAGGTAPQTGRAAIRSDPAAAVNKTMLERQLIG